MSSLLQKILSDLRVRGVMTEDPEQREDLVRRMLSSKKVTVTEDDWDAAVLFQDSLFGETAAKLAANLEALITKVEVWSDVLIAANQRKESKVKSYPGAGDWGAPSGAVEICAREGCGSPVVKRFHRRIRTDLNGRWVCPKCGVEYFGTYVGGYPVATWDKHRPLWLGATKEECLP